MQFAAIKLYPDGTRTEFKTFINPQEPIPPEATEVHHITDDMVKDAPTFAQEAGRIYKSLEFCDYGGYFLTFDLEVLREEFKRVTTKQFLNGRIVDVFEIFRHYNPRKLADAVQHYLNREMFEGAHDASVDIGETLRVFEAQLVAHPELPRSVEGIHNLFFGPDPRYVDSERKFYWRFDEACFNFSDHAGKRMRDVEPGMYRWMLKKNKDFSPEIKQLAKDALEGVFPKKKEIPDGV